MRGVFMCRKGHPLLRDTGRAALRRAAPFPDRLDTVERRGGAHPRRALRPGAHPDECVTLRCEEIASLVEVVRASDAVLLAIRASAPDLVELPGEAVHCGQGPLRLGDPRRTRGAALAVHPARARGEGAARLNRRRVAVATERSSGLIRQLTNAECPVVNPAGEVTSPPSNADFLDPAVAAYGVTAAPLMAAEVSSTVTGLADSGAVTDLIGSPLPTPTHLINVSVGRVMDVALDVTAPVSTNLHA